MDQSFVKWNNRSAKPFLNLFYFSVTYYLSEWRSCSTMTTYSRVGSRISRWCLDKIYLKEYIFCPCIGVPSRTLTIVSKLLLIFKSFIRLGARPAAGARSRDRKKSQLLSGMTECSTSLLPSSNKPCRGSTGCDLATFPRMSREVMIRLGLNHSMNGTLWEHWPSATGTYYDQAESLILYQYSLSAGYSGLFVSVLCDHRYNDVHVADI